MKARSANVRSSLFRLSLALLLCTGLAHSSGCEDQSLLGTDAPEPPELFAAPKGCSHKGDVTQVAQTSLSVAAQAMRRYPFVPAEGPRALAALALAKHCLADEPGLLPLPPGSEAFAARVRADYRALRLRIDQAIMQGRKQDAAREARALLSLLDAQPDAPYVRWLRRIERGAL